MVLKSQGKWLAENGFELCNHTLWHAQLSKYPDNVVQEQIARGQLAIDSVVPGYKVRTFAPPQGLWPRNKELAWLVDRPRVEKDDLLRQRDRAQSLRRSGAQPFRPGVQQARADAR